MPLIVPIFHPVTIVAKMIWNEQVFDKMTKSEQTVSVFAYSDYRSFLEDFYKTRKEKTRYFSYRSFAMAAGVSPSVLRDILAGRRKLTIPVMQKYAEAMRLPQKERRYFELLVLLENAKTTGEKNRIFGEMLSLCGQAGVTMLEKRHYDFFSDWYNSAIRELVTLTDFQNNPEWISKKLSPQITTAQARTAIELLVRIGLLAKDEESKLSQTNAIVSSEYEMASSVLRAFHGQMISLAAQALEKVDREKREISSLTLAVSESCYFRIKERIRAFKEEILATVIEDKNPSETVCQLNFQLFPLVRESDSTCDTGKEVGE